MKQKSLNVELSIASTIQEVQIKPKVMFILKRREDYSTDLANFNNFTVMTGMYNSSSFVSDMLNSENIESTVFVAEDNNSIDKAVSEYNPTHVFIEGLWVVPEKFDVLKQLHPSVIWIVRVHSELPFLAQEGIAISWIYDYLKRDVFVSGNSPRINREITSFVSSGLGEDYSSEIPLLSNFYPVPSYIEFNQLEESDTINIGCFGAMRPLKNHLSQAIAAIEFADKLGKTLKFHINASRVEMNGDNCLKNVRSLFAGSNKHSLVEHNWASHSDFLNLIKNMDVCMQVSFTETFNIVAADASVCGVPTVVSKEIIWADEFPADPTNTVDIVQKLQYTYENSHHIVNSHCAGLRKYVQASKILWLEFLNS